MTTADPLLHQAVESLLRDDDNNTVESLRTILSLLDDTHQQQEHECTPTPKKHSRSATPVHPATLRDALGHSMDDLKDCLGRIMSDRVSLDDLLPMTYDEQANEDAMGRQNAITLTHSSLLAAQLYARLLGMPGALASGLVDLHVLVELNRIVSRWRTECNGREWVVASTQKPAAPPRNKNHSRHKRTRRSLAAEESEYDSDMGSLGEESDANTSFIVDVMDENVLTEYRLVQRGLELASLVAELMTHKQFAGWSQDCRSAIIQSFTSSAATTAALFLYGRRSSKSLNPYLEEVAERVSQKAFLAIQDWMKVDGIASTDVATEILLDSQRNLYSLITMSENDLPNGEEGRSSSAQLASELFQSLALRVSYTVTRVKAGDRQTRLDSLRTPTSKRKGQNSSTPAPLSHRKQRSERRKSLGLSPTPLKSKNRESIGTVDRLSVNKDAEKCTLHPLLQKVISMMQRLITDPRNKASKIRASTCAAVECCLIESMHRDTISYVLRWVLKIMESNAEFHRIAAVRVGTFALMNERLVEQISPARDHEEECGGDMVGALFRALLNRLRDLKQPVRLAATTEMATMFANVKKENHPSLLTLLRVEAENLAEIIRSLVLEETSINGKISAIKALVSLLSLGELLTLPVTQEDVEVMVVICQEAKSVMLRAAAADGLTSLIYYNTSEAVREFLMDQWSQCVLPLVLDSELKVQTKALQLVNQIVLDPLCDGLSKEKKRQAWDILSAVGRRSMQLGGSQLEADALRSAVAKRPDIPNLLKTIIKIGDDSGTAQSLGFWCLFHAIMEHKSDLQEVAAFFKTKARRSLCLDFVVRSFFDLFDRSEAFSAATTEDAIKLYCLDILAKLAFCVDLSFSTILTFLTKALGTFQLETTFIPAAVRLMVASIIVSDGYSASSQLIDCIGPLYGKCESEMESRLSSQSESASDVQILSRIVCTVGELRLIGFASDDTGGKKNVAYMIASYKIDVKPPEPLRKAIMALASGASTTESLRGHSLIALSKMCLRDEVLARESLSIFVEALQKEASQAIRSNAILCMGDMIVRYTNLADRFLPDMAACLQAGIAEGEASSQTLTRKHAVLVLSDLLLQDYIKWRGSLFPSFLLATIDDDNDVALLAETMLCGPLKREKLFSSHFVAAIFLFNGCEAHDMLKGSDALYDLAAGTSSFRADYLNGVGGFPARQRLYEVMLGQLSETEKIAVTAGIAKDILARCLRRDCSLYQACTTTDENDQAYNVLLDALGILCSKSIRPRRSLADDDSEGFSRNEALRLKVKGALIHKVSRKHLLEHMLPMLVQIRETFMSNRSPLLRRLMEYFVVVYSLYPEEVKDSLSLKHPILLQEIEFDAKKGAAR